MTIRLILQTPATVRALRMGAERYQQVAGFEIDDDLAAMAAGPDVSPDFVARQEAAAQADPWLHGFAVLFPEENKIIGFCGFKGAPDEEGMAEIAYGIAPAYQGRGHATEAAHELIAFALASGIVSTLRAHTLPENNASTRVLTKCGFACLGEVTDPEDGLVWRWQRKELSSFSKS